MAGKKEARIASAGSAAVAVMTRRRCAHCGQQLMSDEIQAVRQIKYNGRNQAAARMVYYARGHV